MKPTVALTLAVCCTLYTLSTAASLSRGDAYSMLSLTGDDLRQLAAEVDEYNKILIEVLGNSEIQSILKRSGPGCGKFAACSQLKHGQDALTRMLAVDKSHFGVGGPGKRRRSVDAVAEQRE